MSREFDDLSTRREDEEEPGIDLRRYLDLFLRHWKLVVIVTAAVVGAEVVKTYLTAPVYRAAAVISVEREKMSLSDVGLGEGRFLASPVMENCTGSHLDLVHILFAPKWFRRIIQISNKGMDPGCHPFCHRESCFTFGIIFQAFS